MALFIGTITHINRIQFSLTLFMLLRILDRYSLAFKTVKLLIGIDLNLFIY